MTSVPLGSRDWSFRDNAPTATDKVDASKADVELDDLWASHNALLTALAITIRDDNQPEDAIIRLRSLHNEVVLLIASKAGWQPKVAAAVATTANITLSGEQTIDGVLTSGSRVLVKDQSTASQNGVYVSAAGVWARATDLDTAAELGYAFVPVTGGTDNGGTSWVLTQAVSAVAAVGTTALTWTQAGGTVGPIPNAKLADMAQATVKGRAAGAGTGKPVDLTSTAIGLILGLSINVLDHGAIGDGASHPLSERYATLVLAQAQYPHVTSLSQEIDWAATQGALNKANETRSDGRQGGYVIAPVGTYLASDTIVIPRNCKLVGEGSNSSCISAASGFVGDCLIQLGDLLRDSTPAFASQVQGFRLQCNSLMSYGVYSIKAQEEAGVFNCIVHSPVTKGVFFDNTNTTGAYCSECMVEKSHIWLSPTCTEGVEFYGVKGFLTQTTVLPLGTPTGVLKCVRIQQNSFVTVQGCHFENYDRAISIEQAANAVLINNDGGNATARNGGAGGDLIYIQGSTGCVIVLHARHSDTASGRVIYNGETGAGVKGISIDTTTYGKSVAFYVKPKYDQGANGSIFSAGIDVSSNETKKVISENTDVYSVNARRALRTTPITLANHFFVGMGYDFTAPTTAADAWKVTTYSPSTGGDGSNLKVVNWTGSVWSDVFGFSLAASGPLSSAWNGSHAKMGNYRLWVDGSGKLRIKSGAPTSDTDGTIVGTQT